MKRDKTAIRYFYGALFLFCLTAVNFLYHRPTPCDCTVNPPQQEISFQLNEVKVDSLVKWASSLVKFNY